jgi:hypothetical protein
LTIKKMQRGKWAAARPRCNWNNYNAPKVGAGYDMAIITAQTAG